MAVTSKNKLQELNRCWINTFYCHPEFNMDLGCFDVAIFDTHDDVVRKNGNETVWNYSSAAGWLLLLRGLNRVLMMDKDSRDCVWFTPGIGVDDLKTFLTVDFSVSQTIKRHRFYDTHLQREMSLSNCLLGVGVGGRLGQSGTISIRGLLKPSVTVTSLSNFLPWKDEEEQWNFLSN